MILKRQRAILYMLQRLRRSVTLAELTQWSFLLRHEGTHSATGYSYDFVPCESGPASFLLRYETRKLARSGLLSERGDECWRLTTPGRAMTITLPEAVGAHIRDILRRFSDCLQDDLAEHVRLHFPNFVAPGPCWSDRAPLPCEMAAYTIGYEGITVDGFLRVLVESRLRRLIDVRANPVARRYGFHKRTLDNLCSRVGIEYVHFPELGIELSQRRYLNTPDHYTALFEGYRRGTLARHAESVDAVAGLMATLPSALMCFETQAMKCHRSILSRAVSARTDLHVKHL